MIKGKDPEMLSKVETEGLEAVWDVLCVTFSKGWVFLLFIKKGF